MHLKTLKIVGFKSFKDAINLEFSKGISAIVGPNGSGKSNITDAIKWVLGEQSIKSLRGKKMEDVIFSGTEKRPPSAYAEVVLVLDNTDGTLLDYTKYIEIGRKLYRSGESDYRINKKTCKLRDVQSIFMDTGLGKNGYSLISQGGIEKIVGSSPAELRAIFEEAVGIVSYKNKKNDAEKKLEHTTDHIDRLNDILQEIKKQMGPLRKQSEKAQIYQELYEELKILDIALFYEQTNEAMKNICDFKNELDEQVNRCEKNKQEIDEIDKKYQAITIENRMLTRLNEESQKERHAIKNKLEYFQKETIRSSSQREANRISQERLKSEAKNIESDGRKKQQLIAEQIDELEKTSEKFEVIQEKQKLKKLVLEKLLAKEKLEKNRLKQHQEKVIGNEKRKEGLIERRLQLRSDIQNVTTQLNLLEEEIKKIQKQELDSQRNYKVIESKLNDCIIKKEHLSGVQKKARIIHSETEKKQQEVVDEIQVVSNIIKINQSKVDYLKNIQEGYKDYFPAIQKIMTSEKELGDAHHQVYGPVGELFTTKKRYLRAIDVALGGKSQNIVVSNVAIASQCINLLKKERLGRATFLPLDNLRNSIIDQTTLAKIKEMDGVEGLASDLVETKSEFFKCAQNLLGRSIVTDSFKSGKDVQRELKGRFTIVTLEGEIFYPGGAILGGQNRKNKESPLSKKIEINNLLQIIEAKKDQLAKLTIELEAIQKLSCKEKEDAIFLSEKIKTIDRWQWEKEESKKNLHARIIEYKQEIERFKKEKSKLNQQKKDLLDQQLIVDLEYQQKKEALEKPNSADQLDGLRERIEKERCELQDIEMDKARIEAKINALDKQLEFFRNQEQDNKSRSDEINDKYIEYQDENEELANHEKELNTKSSLLEDKIKMFKEKSKKNQNQYTANEKVLSKLQESIKAANHTLIINNDLKNKLRNDIKTVETKIDYLEKKMFENYGMNQLMVEDAYKEYQKSDKLEDLDRSEKRQGDLKAKINQLGSININAIESYQELLIRHDYMANQLADLNLGKKELQKIISELYQAISNQFKNNFIKLQESFSRIFSTLFEGGQAYLEFTDPEGVLEGGIELVAQPPGKRLRQLSLLSGGEKSMVAIALLFSFLEINPSPFCVIDEVDAALDEHNIFRYINYLKKVSKNNQFITITHRRQTLEVCDNLYGVSMSKDGISQLVSVRLMDYA